MGTCLLYTSDAADEEDSVDLGGRRIIKKKIRRTKSKEPLSLKLASSLEVKILHFPPIRLLWD